MKHLRQVMAAVLVLAAGQLAAAAPQDWQQDWRKLQDAKQRAQQPNQPPPQQAAAWQAAIKLADDMLTKYREPAQVRDLRLARAECLLGTKKYDDALAELEKLQVELPEDKDALARATLLSGDVLRAAGKFAPAVAAYQKVAKTWPDQSDKAADALLRAADVLAADLKKLDDALVVLAQVEKDFASQTVLAADSVRRAAAACEAANDPLKAAGFYAAAAEKHAAAFDDKTRAGLFAKAVECLVKAQKLPEAQTQAAKAEKSLDAVASRAPFALKLVEMLAAQKKYPEARAAAETAICAYPLEMDVCQAAQAAAVESLRAESKFDEALGAARILYDGAGSEATIKAAAYVVAQAFRSVDGNLARANEFLAFQRFGQAGPDAKPGTPDDLAVNHLAAVKYPPADPARDKRFADALAAYPASYEGYRAKAILNIYWGKPKEAAQMFRLAFKSCPEANVPQAAAELVMIGMKAYTASFAGLDKIFEFISYGPKGKAGTASLPDPFQGL